MSHRSQHDSALDSVYLGQVFKAEYRSQKSNFELKEQTTKLISSRTARDKDNALNLEVSKFEVTFQTNFSKGRPEMRSYPLWISN